MLGCPGDPKLTVLDLSQYSGGQDLTLLLIRSFLEWEKRHRFQLVDDVVNALHKAVTGYDGVPTGPGPSQILDAGSSPGSDKLVGLYLQLCNFKAVLSAWRAQLAGFRRHAREVDASDAKPNESLEEYVETLLNEYDMAINKCEMSLQGTSLAFSVVCISLRRMYPRVLF